MIIPQVLNPLNGQTGFQVVLSDQDHPVLPGHMIHGDLQFSSNFSAGRLTDI